jgi:ribosome biogenesis GTPase
MEVTPNERRPGERRALGERAPYPFLAMPAEPIGLTRDRVGVGSGVTLAEPAMSIPLSNIPSDLGLPALGWSPHWAGHAADLGRQNPASRPARVIRADRGHCVVHTGDAVVRAELVGSLDPAPVTGDWVLVSPADRVVALLPRRTAFTRGAGRTDTRAQVLAANVDIVAVVHGLSAPPNLHRIERLTALAWASGAQPVVVLSKADLCGDPDAELAEVRAACPGAEAVAVSVHPDHPDHRGLATLRALLPAGTTGTFVGPSGVGKSSLVNALAGAEILATQEIRNDGKGRHTSVARELVPLPWGALVIDTPGLRGVQLWDAADGLEATFADIAALAEQCRFNDCRHRTEPGCAVQAAVADGSLSARRVDSYERLQREQAWLAARYDARLRAEQRARWKQLIKDAKRRARP